MTDLPADRKRLLEMEDELDEMRLRIATYQSAGFNRDDLMLEATIRIAGAASQCKGAARAIEGAIRES